MTDSADLPDLASVEETQTYIWHYRPSSENVGERMPGAPTVGQTEPSIRMPDGQQLEELTGYLGIARLVGTA